MGFNKASFFVLCLFFSFLGLLLPVNSAVAGGRSPVQRVEVRYPDPEKLKEFQDDRDFQYGQDIKPGVTFWERLKWKIKQLLSELFAGQAYQQFWKYVLYIFAIGITVFVVLKLLKVDFTGLIGRQPRSQVLAYETYEENIHEMDFQALIDEAVQQKDFRKAIRLSYLHILKNLTDRELIDWSPGKTNRSYVTELRNMNLRHSFENITGTFEFVWYGGSELSENNFVQTRQTFQEFYQQIKRQA